MNSEEKYLEYKDLVGWAEAWKENFDDFHNKLIAELHELFFSYWPEMETYRQQFSTQILEAARHSVGEAYLCLYNVNEYLKEKIPVEGDQSVRKIKSREEEKKILEELFLTFPVLNNDEFLIPYWEDYEMGLRVDNFYLQVHQKIKEIQVQFHYDSIMQYDGDHLRLMNCQLYYMAAIPFAEFTLNLKNSTKEAQPALSDQ